MFRIPIAPQSFLKKVLRVKQGHRCIAASLHCSCDTGHKLYIVHVLQGSDCSKVFALIVTALKSCCCFCVFTFLHIFACCSMCRPGQAVSPQQWLTRWSRAAWASFLKNVCCLSKDLSPTTAWRSSRWWTGTSECNHAPLFAIHQLIFPSYYFHSNWNEQWNFLT